MKIRVEYNLTRNGETVQRHPNVIVIDVDVAAAVGARHDWIDPAEVVVTAVEIV